MTAMKTKTVGIIGGLGPETTAEFYLELIKKSKKINAQYRPEMIIINVAMDTVVEESFIRGNNESEEYIKILVLAAKKLEKAGADFLVIPCNSVHIFIEEIRKSVKIPVLSIVEETKNFLVQSKIKKIGLLATSATLNAKLYQKAFTKDEIETLVPNSEEQKELNMSINKLVNNEDSKKEKILVKKIIKKLAKEKVNTILLACTDLQLVAPKINNIKIEDTMMILVEKTVNEIFRK
jgi:aspartate racemase